MFPEDQPEYEDNFDPEEEEPFFRAERGECHIVNDFSELLREWPPTADGMDIHVLTHMLHVLLFQLRQMFNPMSMVGFCFNMIQAIEAQLRENGYVVEYPDGESRLYGTPELRDWIEQEVSGIEVPDSIPEDWTTEGEEE